MLQKNEYLIKAFKAECYTRRNWIISIVAIIDEDPNKYKEDPYPYRIVQLPDNIGFVDPENNGDITLIKKATKPLCKFLDPIEVDDSVCLNIESNKTITTTIGNLIFNLTCLASVFGKKIPYQTGRVSISNIENKYIAPRLQDTPKTNIPRNDEYIYVDELNLFTDSIPYIRNLASLCVYSVTPKNITPAPGVEEFKKVLLEKYAGKLHDKVELTNFESELQAFDEEYLKDDPSNGKFLSGKIKDIARKKMFLTIGSDATFSSSATASPVLSSLDDEWSTNPGDFTQSINASRYGSYARGVMTQDGGTAAKLILRALNVYTINPTDCGTNVGKHKNLPKELINKIIGREVRVGDKWVLIKNLSSASKFINKDITIKSPMFCKTDGNQICSHCAGTLLASNPTGVATAVTEISAVMLNAPMKLMHAVKLQTHTIGMEIFK